MSVSVRAVSTPRLTEDVYYRSQHHNNSFAQQHQQQQQQQQQRVYSNNNNASTRTLPFNYRQTNFDSLNNTSKKNNNNNNNTTLAYSPTSSCIDYSNTHYNSDWAMRHAHIEPVNQ